MNSTLLLPMVSDALEHVIRLSAHASADNPIPGALNDVKLAYEPLFNADLSMDAVTRYTLSIRLTGAALALAYHHANWRPTP